MQRTEDADVCVHGACKTEREGVGSDADRANHREEQACYGIFALLVEIEHCVYFCEPAGPYVHNTFTDKIIFS